MEAIEHARQRDRHERRRGRPAVIALNDPPQAAAPFGEFGEQLGDIRPSKATERHARRFDTNGDARRDDALAKSLGDDRGSLKIQKVNGQIQHTQTCPSIKS